MRGIAFPGNRQIEFIDVADPTPESNEVVIEMKASGMCGSDLHAYRDERNAAANLAGLYIAGHEPSGVVVAVGSNVATHVARVGNRVMVHHYHGCSICTHCRAGWPQLCNPSKRTTYSANAHGAHAPLMKVHAATLVHLDDALSFTAGAAISCGTGTAWGALERLELRGGERIAIFGQGPVGISATLIAAARGMEVIAIDLDDRRLQLATASGAAHTINATDTDPTEWLMELTNGRGVAAVVETSGSTHAASSGLKALKVWGKICLVGIGSTLGLETKALLDRQVTAMTSYTMSINGQKQCSDFIVEKDLNVDSIFSHQWRLDQAIEAYELSDSQSDGKGVFIF
jgi:D-arabinose 1-dehydrogenase-like Zn-dependent alcohol dehydrogenase